MHNGSKIRFRNWIIEALYVPTWGGDHGNLVIAMQMRHLRYYAILYPSSLDAFCFMISNCLCYAHRLFIFVIHMCKFISLLRWRRNGHNGVSNHQPHHCLLNLLFGCRSKKTSKLSVTGLCAGNSPGTGEFPAQMVSNAENVSIWWRHHALVCLYSDEWCMGSVAVV